MYKNGSYYEVQYTGDIFYQISIIFSMFICPVLKEAC